LLAAGLIALLAASARAAPPPTAPMAFTAIDGEQTAISSTWKIPRGFSQHVLSDESDLDIYPGNDWTDMNTVNEQAADPQAGRYLYRTHEVRPHAGRPAAFPGGAVSVVDLHDGDTTLLLQRADWEALDGIVWTPWHSLLVAEETGRALLADPEVPQARHGLLYEIRLQDHTTVGATAVRPLLGSMAHEGIELDADGNVYVVDEYRAGAIFRFVPDRTGDLSSGDLHALKLDAASPDNTGPAHWVKLDRAAVQVSARAAAAASGASTYHRPEDLERIGDTLYVAVTGEHRVLAIKLGDSPVVSNFANGAIADTPGATFRKVDNLAAGPDGRLWIIEDNRPSDIWVADPDGDGDGASDGIRLFASFNDGSAEGTGIYFGKDPHTLFVNLQHTADHNDRTIVIRQDHGR
jgi:secreted PhoX family phosphatase